MIQDGRGALRDNAGPLYRTSVVVHLALAFGPTILGVLVLWLSRQGAVPAMPLGEARLLVYGWLAVTAVATLAVAKLWAARIEPFEADLRQGRAPLLPEAVLTLLLPLWALIEAPALLGVLLFMLTGAPLVLAAALLYLWAGFWFARPRPEWFRRG